MNYYEVAVSSTKYHGQHCLTYSGQQNIDVGTIVSAPLRNTSTLGVVLALAKPMPRAKPITKVHPIKLPPAQIDLLQWLRQYYPAPISTIVSLFLPSALVESDQAPGVKSKSYKPQPLPPLTDEQAQALKTLSSTKTTTALLHGETGTGKTRIYVELSRRAIAAGKSVVVLVPEIGLTPQMMQVFEVQFPGQVRTIHSKLTPKQRRQTWQQIYDQTKPQIVIGPRSALFMPVKDIGLIVVDEAHDNGYKQDQLPYYDATRVAAKLANISGALCLYGTATPKIADYWHLAQHKTPVARLTKSINADIKPPSLTIIDASDRGNFKRSTVFSEAALKVIASNIQNTQQSLVFLNRRGTARYVSCSNCGWYAACPNCDTPLTYHGDQFQLRCHTCGHKQSVPTSCPVCRSTELRYQRRGTKALQTELQHLFPEARIARFDSDNTKADSLAAQYKTIAQGDIDIILGTQVIAKGLDLAKLSAVIIPQADLSAYLPDFTADEQTYQLLRQVIGRVGRTNKDSQVIIQTYQPNSPVVQAIISNNWTEFYRQQIDHRNKYNFPPFSYLLQLTVSRASAKSAMTTAQKLLSSLTAQHPHLSIRGPAPRFQEKTMGKYQWQLIVVAKDRSDLLKVVADLPAGWRYNIDPTNLL